MAYPKKTSRKSMAKRFLASCAVSMAAGIVLGAVIGILAYMLLTA